MALIHTASRLAVRPYRYCFLFIFEDRFLIREPAICNFSKQTALWILVTCGLAAQEEDEGQQPVELIFSRLPL